MELCGVGGEGIVGRRGRWDCVEGSVGELFEIVFYLLEDVIDVEEDFFVGETEDVEAHAFKLLSSKLIAFVLFKLSVVSTINLND